MNFINLAYILVLCFVIFGITYMMISFYKARRLLGQAKHSLGFSINNFNLIFGMLFLIDSVISLKTNMKDYFLRTLLFIILIESIGLIFDPASKLVDEPKL